jgi:hypothetical protein
MSLARFFARNADAILRVADIVNRDVLIQRLTGQAVAVVAGDHVDDDPARSEGYVFAVDLASRLYPTLGLTGPKSLVERAAQRAQQINPIIDIVEPTDDMPTLLYEATGSAHGVAVSSSGWNVTIDGEPAPYTSAEGAASLAAATLGINEVFRDVFADSLDHPRKEISPTSWNLITLLPTSDGLSSGRGVDVGRVLLAGCGAVGQAAVATLRATEVAGTLIAVDPERVELTNLQRYILTDDSSEGDAKVEIIERALAGTPLTVEPVEAHWTAEAVSRASKTLAAVDSAADRIAIQAGLPKVIYNAYTDQLDLGWSRHEAFGTDACLACLYWPSGRRSSRSEQIGDILDESPARITGYVITATPIGEPLPATIQPPRGISPQEVERWQVTPLIDDIALRRGVPASKIEAWRGRTIDELYREGICGGALIELADSAGAREHATVPLAQQSAMAGIMLAVQLITACSDDLLLYRPAHNEGRINMLKSPSPYTTQRARTIGCLCSDLDFVDRYQSLWSQISE